MQLKIIVLLLIVFFNQKTFADSSSDESGSEESGSDDYSPTVVFRWSYLNFTFDSSNPYEEYVSNNRYIPQNNYLSGMQTYKDYYYFSLPRFRDGTPVTLVRLARDSSKTNPLLTPYPDWDSNVGDDCSTLQNIRGMEIDNENGILWVLDGVRTDRVSDGNNCPQKLVLLDLNDNGNVVHTYTFPEEISSQSDGYLSEIALDVSDQCAFIAEGSNAHPGLVIYSRNDDQSWKLFDSDTMSPASPHQFEVNGESQQISYATGIFGVTLSPATLPDSQRHLYYTTPNGEEIYSIPLQYLKDDQYYDDSDEWSQHISTVGRKGHRPTNDITMDDQQNLWLACVGSQGLALLDNSSHVTSDVYQNGNTFAWPQTFSFDDEGYMYVTSSKNAIYVLNSDQDVPEPDDDNEYAYSVLRFQTHAQSYITHNLR